jgi:hypothetical protein
MKLRDIAHSRTGDKGNTSNISVIAYDAKDYPMLLAQVTSERVKTYFSEIVKSDVVRYELDNLCAEFCSTSRSRRRRHAFSGFGCTRKIIELCAAGFGA